MRQSPLEKAKAGRAQILIEEIEAAPSLMEGGMGAVNKLINEAKSSMQTRLRSGQGAVIDHDKMFVGILKEKNEVWNLICDKIPNLERQAFRWLSLKIEPKFMKFWPGPPIPPPPLETPKTDDDAASI